MRRFWRWLRRLWPWSKPKVDAETAPVEALAREIAQEIDREIVDELDLIGMDDHQPL